MDIPIVGYTHVSDRSHGVCNANRVNTPLPFGAAAILWNIEILFSDASYREFIM